MNNTEKLLELPSSCIDFFLQNEMVKLINLPYCGRANSRRIDYFEIHGSPVSLETRYPLGNTIYVVECTVSLKYSVCLGTLEEDEVGWMFGNDEV